ncbi:MAG: LON peptidase substrate-binding domain-containing protein [Rhodospirillales bacterium]|nr:LON peptidase substrate-binding domain-containing protein [Rhodospirillales bacterium]
MTGPALRAESLPGTIPVFPLEGALLLPGGKLPLNIFEPRYLAMTEDALGQGRMLGMVQPDPASPATAAGPGVYRVGCLGRITSFSETGDGRYLITLTGLARFRILTEVEGARGYRRMAVDFAPYRDDPRTPEAPTGVAREALLAALRGYFARQGFDANWDAIGKLGDPMLAITLAMSCPFAPAEKQALLEAADPATRAETLLALLRMGAAAPPEPTLPS